MSKIEQANEARRSARRVRENIAKALGNNSPSNDKHEFKLFETKVGLQISLRHGEYGNSSSYACDHRSTREYICKAFNAMAAEIGARAVSLAEDDERIAVDAAADEARSVLNQVAAMSADGG